MPSGAEVVDGVSIRSILMMLVGDSFPSTRGWALRGTRFGCVASDPGVFLTASVHLSKLDSPSRSDPATELTAPDERHVKIPHRDLSEEALRGVIESFVLREGTDYGQRDYSLEEKIAAVTHQLDRGEAVIVFDPDTATVSIVAASRPSRRARNENPGHDGG